MIRRKLMLTALVAVTLAACSSPAAPRLPPTDSEDEEEGPDQGTGLTGALAEGLIILA